MVYEDNFMGDRGRKFDGFWYLVNALVVSQEDKFSFFQEDNEGVYGV